MQAADQGICFQVYGRVQGVGFRHFTWKHAKELGVRGTVQNMADGTVFIQAIQQAAVLASFRELVHRGPVFAKVTRIEESPLDLADLADPSTFQILRS